ncbi:MAG: signal peptidase II [Gemmatimonadales bacterium]
MPRFTKALCFWPVVLTVFLSDCATKTLVERHLHPDVPHQVLGDFFRLTLVYNQSAAMSVDLGPGSRLLLSLTSMLALGLLWYWYRQPSTTSVQLILGLALVSAGAAGNLWDRLRSDRGVVDFLDVGLTSWRFWIFNVADVSVFLGAALLLLASLRQESPPDTA